MRPDATIARLSGQAWTAASRTAGSGDPKLLDRNCAIAFMVSRLAPDAWRTRGHALFVSLHPASLTKALAVKHVSGKLQMGSARLSKGSTVLNREIRRDNFPSGALSISGSLCGRRQIAKGSGHTLMLSLI